MVGTSASSLGGPVGTPASRWEGYLGEQPGQCGAERGWALIAALLDTLQHGHVVPRRCHGELGGQGAYLGAPWGAPVPHPHPSPHLPAGQGEDQHS